MNKAASPPIWALASIPFIVVCSIIASSALDPPPKQVAPIPMVIQAKCDQCAEPFFVPTFRFKVVEGKWPEKGILRCTSDGTPVMTCENGLKVSMAGVTFSTGGE